MGLEELSSAAHGNSGPASKVLRACRCPQRSTVLVQHGIGDVGDFNVGQLSSRRQREAGHARAVGSVGCRCGCWRQANQPTQST